MLIIIIIPTEKGHAGYRTHSGVSASTCVKVQKVYHGQYNYTIFFNQIIAAKFCILDTW